MGGAIGAARDNAVRYSWMVLVAQYDTSHYSYSLPGNSEATDPCQCIL